MSRVLVLNAGSSSLKWSVLHSDTEVVAGANVAWRSQATEDRANQLQATLRRLPSFDRAGHRVVHGGSRFREAVAIDEPVRRGLAGIEHLDPEHMRPALAGIDAVASTFPEVVQVAAFDTAFHRTLPDAATGYGLPFEWSERFRLERFGFHGLSVAYAVERASELLGATLPRMVVCHLGSGCSLTAVERGRSLDTTMGFTPLEGPMMATRSGSIDPGLLCHLQTHCGITTEQLRDTLTRSSGLLGVSGVSSDLRQVLSAAQAGSARAQLAYDRFVLGIRRSLGAMVGVLGGIDVLVFTGGIGENSPRIRRCAARALAFAGLELDEAANASDAARRATSSEETDRVISRQGSPIAALVIRAREDLTILKEVLRLCAL
ncbi:MAG: acetate/propionate family kinase [Proteobacteria bacterium]|nr:acetate/propionate family kinase [Pseudomonadota bacterium]